MSLRLSRPPNQWMPEWADRLVNDLEVEFTKRDVVYGFGYVPTNVTKTRAFDADSTTLAEVADVLGTLIEDMTDRGKLSKLQS